MVGVKEAKKSSVYLNCYACHVHLTVLGARFPPPQCWGRQLEQLFISDLLRPSATHGYPPRRSTKNTIKADGDELLSGGHLEMISIQYSLV